MSGETVLGLSNRPNRPMRPRQPRPHSGGQDYEELRSISAAHCKEL